MSRDAKVNICYTVSCQRRTRASGYLVLFFLPIGRERGKESEYALIIPWNSRSPLQIYRMPEFPDRSDFPLYNANRRRWSARWSSLQTAAGSEPWRGNRSYGDLSSEWMAPCWKNRYIHPDLYCSLCCDLADYLCKHSDKGQSDQSKNASIIICNYPSLQPRSTRTRLFSYSQGCESYDLRLSHWLHWQWCRCFLLPIRTNVHLSGKYFRRCFQNRWFLPFRSTWRWSGLEGYVHQKKTRWIGLYRKFPMTGVIWCDFPIRGRGVSAESESALAENNSKSSVSVSKVADFRHVDMDGQTKGELPVWG